MREMNMPREGASRRQTTHSNFTPLAVALALAIATFLLYLPTGSYSWVNLDDNQYVTDNAYVANGLRPHNVAWAFTHFHMGYWIPATWISHMIDCQVWGLNPGPPHLVNAALHALNSALVFALFYLTTGARWRSAVVAALFAWHPLHVESVAWLAERKDVLSTFFWLLALFAYVKFTKNRRASFYIATTAFFVVGLMAKPNLVMLPFSLLLLDLWPLGRLHIAAWPFVAARRTESEGARSLSIKYLLVEKIPWFLISVAFSILTLLSQSREGALSSLEQLPLLMRLENAVLSYARYLLNTFWPAKLAAFYPWPESIPLGRTLLASLFLLLVTILAVLASRSRRYLAFGWFWFVGMMIPMIGLFQAGAQTMADRFTYIPLLGVFVVLAWALGDLAGNFPFSKVPIAILCAVALASCLFLSSLQMRQWQDPIALFSRILAVVGPTPLANDHLGAALYQKGDQSGAIEQFEIALSLNPKYATAHTNLGAVLFQTGKKEEALAHLRTAVELDPNNVQALNNYGNALQEIGDLNDALEQYEVALRNKPAYWIAHSNLGNVLLRLSRKEEAIAQFREALRLRPGFKPAEAGLKSVGLQ